MLLFTRPLRHHLNRYIYRGYSLLHHNVEGRWLGGSERSSLATISLPVQAGAVFVRVGCVTPSPASTGQ